MKNHNNHEQLQAALEQALLVCAQSMRLMGERLRLAQEELMMVGVSPVLLQQDAQLQKQQRALQWHYEGILIQVDEHARAIDQPD